MCALRIITFKKELQNNTRVLLLEKVNLVPMASYVHIGRAVKATAFPI